jgi:uridylate kinase
MFPDTIDWRYLKLFSKFIRRFSQERRFVIVTGGGRLSRMYQEAAAHVASVTDEDKDWLGIHATRCNAHLLRTIFADIADPVVIDERGKIEKLRHPVTVASGWRPGWSTDYIASVLAHDFRAGASVVAGKPSHVYDKDFTKHRDAKPFDELSWSAYRKLIPARWNPGFHSPVDPVAAKFSHKNGVDAIVLDGRDLKNLERLLAGREFVGTVIR